MKPEEFIRIRREIMKTVNRLRGVIDELEKETLNCDPPSDRRPATASDIVEGAVIWYEYYDSPSGYYWQIVDEVQYPNDPFKAYTAEDGCRYGLDGAFVSKGTQ